MKKAKNIPVVLTIAGSDSGGGAGIQADLRAFAAFNVTGTSAITCLTAQNPREVRKIQAVGPEMVVAQIRTICDYFPVAAVKTGMLFNEAIVRAVAAEIKRKKIPVVVVDPVCRATSGRRLLTEGAFRALCSKLLPLATVITPNVPEAEMILKRRIRNHADQRAAALKLGEKFHTACVVKGGHLAGKETVDVLCHDNRLSEYTSGRVNIKSHHGTGCVFSAALAAALANGRSLEEAVPLAKDFVYRILKNQTTP